MMTQQTTGEAKPGRVGRVGGQLRFGETGNALCHHFFPAPLGSRCGGRPASHGLRQGFEKSGLALGINLHLTVVTK